jgi:hypothetical protein
MELSPLLHESQCSGLQLACQDRPVDCNRGVQAGVRGMKVRNRMKLSETNQTDPNEIPAKPHIPIERIMPEIICGPGGRGFESPRSPFEKAWNGWKIFAVSRASRGSRTYQSSRS